VQGTVELAIAAAIEPMSIGLTRRCRDRRRGGRSCELGVGGEAADASDLADQLRCGQRPAAALGDQASSQVGDQRRQLGLERADRAGQLADAPQLIASDPDSCRLLGALEATVDAVLPAAADQCPGWDLELGPEVVQVRSADRRSAPSAARRDARDDRRAT